MKPSSRVVAVAALTALLVAVLIWGIAAGLGPGDPQDDLLALPSSLAPATATPPRPLDPGAAATGEGSSDVPDLADPGGDMVTVTAVDGGVERRRTGGDWAPLSPNSTVVSGDRLRTSAQGSLTLQFGGASTLNMGADSELELIESSPKQARWTLDRGHLALRSLTRDKDVRILSGKGGPRIQARNAQVEILRVSSILAASTLRGEVKLISKRRALDIPDGLMSWAMASKRPANPKVLIKQASLKLRPLRKTETDRDSLTVQGRAHFLAEVWVNGKALARRGSRRFSSTVPLELGLQTITVRARVPGGEAETQTLTITRVEASAKTQDSPSPAIRKKKKKKKKRSRKGKFKATVRWGR